MGPVPNPEEQRDHPNHNSDSDIENTEHPDVMINVEVSDSDSDDDNDDDEHGGYMGYQALSSHDVGVADQESDYDEELQTEDASTLEDVLDSDHGEGSSVQIPDGLIHQVRSSDSLPGYMQVPDLPRPNGKDLLWNQARQTEMNLDKGHAEKIKTLMSGIQLPSSNIPDWARNLSDEQWQEQVVNRLTGQGTSHKQEVDPRTNPGTETLESTNQNSVVTVSDCDNLSSNDLTCNIEPH